MHLDLERTPRDAASLLRLGLPRLLEVCRQYRVRVLILFGSLARGEAGPTSDIDLAVDFSPDAESDVLAFLEASVAALGTDRVDVVDMRGAPPLVLREIGVRGVPLYEDEHGLAARLQVAALGRYMDTAGFRRLRSHLLKAAADG